MARVINAQRLLSLFADQYPQKSFSIAVRDELLKNNNATYTVTDGKVGERHPVTGPTLTVGIRELAQLLLGYHTSEKAEPFNTLFPEKEPQMHFMLE